MTDIFAEFQDLIRKLNTNGIEYAIGGGWALAIHGAPRATVDIDLLILSENLEKAWQVAEDLGYRSKVCRFLSTMELLKSAEFPKSTKNLRRFTQ